jgi:hypothetical protein
MDHNPQQRSVGLITNCANLIGLDAFTVNRHPTQQFVQLGPRRVSVEEYLVLFLQFIARMSNSVREISIIGEKQQTGCFPVQTSHRHDPLRYINEIEHGPATSLILSRSDVSGRFIQ